MVKIIKFGSEVQNKMSNYHHSKIDKLDDFRNTPTIVNHKRNFKKHVQGYNQGEGKYEAQSKYKQTGPIVMATGRYVTYHQMKPTAYYATPVVVGRESCLEKCCACLGSILCCMCLCDLLN